MKVLVVSDTHGHEENLERVLEKESPVNCLIHAGDVEGQEDYFEVLAECPVHIVSGNNDFFSDLPREEEFFLKGHKVLLTHGHYYGVSMGTERIVEEGRARKAELVIFGHTHRPVIEQKADITVVNPGSLSYPRQRGRRPSYIIITTDQDHIMHYEIKEL
ncbi:MAG: metallophosphoesterase family protein [Lachnospiraceae bacterium]|jgi:putative phosphoesterase